MNKPKSIEEWKDIITTARTSGLSDKDWCAANGVSINSFYYNVRRLRKHACEIPVANNSHVAAPQAVVPLEIVDEISQSEVYSSNDDPTPISINFNGISVSVSNHAEPAVISAVVSALKGISC